MTQLLLLQASILQSSCGQLAVVWQQVTPGPDKPAQSLSAQSILESQSLSKESKQFVSAAVFPAHLPGTAASQIPAALPQAESPHWVSTPSPSGSLPESPHEQLLEQVWYLPLEHCEEPRLQPPWFIQLPFQSTVPQLPHRSPQLDDTPHLPFVLPLLAHKHDEEQVK